MALWDKVVEAVNRAMNTEASQILKELRAECPKKTGKTAASFKIMSMGSDARASIGGAQGLIHTVRIGSTLDTAFYADEGNNQRYSYFGGKGNPGMPNYARGGAKMLFYDGSYHLSSSTYEGKHSGISS